MFLLFTMYCSQIIKFLIYNFSICHENKIKTMNKYVANKINVFSCVIKAFVLYLLEMEIITKATGSWTRDRVMADSSVQMEPCMR